MKRTLERVLFMLFGAILAAISYLAGNFDILSAEDTEKSESAVFGDVLIKGRLLVQKGIIVSDTAGQSQHPTAVMIMAESEMAHITLGYKMESVELTDSLIRIATGVENNDPYAMIHLRDKTGNSATGASHLGWSNKVKQ